MLNIDLDIYSEFPEGTEVFINSVKTRFTLETYGSWRASQFRVNYTIADEPPKNIIFIRGGLGEFFQLLDIDNLSKIDFKNGILYLTIRTR